MVLDIINQANFKDRDNLLMRADLELVRDLDGGTPQMRKAGIKYLPKFPGEKPIAYKRRLERTFLFNGYKMARNAFVGMVFKQNPVLGDDIDPIIKKHLEDIDNAGTHLDVFARELLTDAMEGHALVLVDMEKPLPAGSFAKQAEGRRPYWVKYKKDQVCNKDRARINGEEVLTSITFEECATVREGRYGTQEVYQYRTLYLPILAEDEYGRATSYGPMQWYLERLKKDGTLEQIDGGETKLPRIPVRAIYTNKKGFLISDPCLLDLAYLTVAHWQEWSDFKTQQKALVPILFEKKVRETSQGKDKAAPKDTGQQEETILGPNVSYRATGAQDDLKYVQHSPDAVNISRQSLMDTEQRMSAAGLSIVAAKGDREITATEKVMDQGERVADLATIARALQDVLEELLAIHAGYLGLQDAEGDGGSIQIVVDASATPDPDKVSDKPAMVPPSEQGDMSGASMVQ
jgi:hypothetical protein